MRVVVGTKKKMWLTKGQLEKKAGKNELVAVAIDKDKGSQHALKWAVEKLLSRGQTVLLIHVIKKPSHSSNYSQSQVSDVTSGPLTHKQQLEKQAKDLFLTFHCFCTRKNVQCLDITLEDNDIVKAISDYVTYAAIESLILGASSHHAFLKRFKAQDVPAGVSKAAPDFCTVYIISKGKITGVRNASRAAPHVSPLHDQIHKQKPEKGLFVNDNNRLSMRVQALERSAYKPRIVHDDIESVRSPYAKGKLLNGQMGGGDFLESERDVSLLSPGRSSISSSRPSTDYMSSPVYEIDYSGRNSRISVSSERSVGSIRSGTRFNDFSASSDYDLSPHSQDTSGRTSCASEQRDEVEAEMRRLKLELKQTMNLYSTACKEALTAKQKASELHRWRLEEERRLEEAWNAEGAAREMVEQERAKCKAAIDAAEASQRVAEMEVQKRMDAEKKAQQEADELRRAMNALATKDVIRYRKYAIEEIEEATNFFDASRKIGEGGYGPVYKCYLDHTPVAVKVLRPDANQGRSQFQQEVEVLSCIRHPNMVLLLGACPEYGCLVYEYLAKGSLEDCLFVRGNSPVLPWQIRFRIAAEIATGLLFLHQTKPEPLVHRDLKPANILLDRNYVSKISDVGLARLVPPSITDNVTQYRMTSTAGTFCYIDPEYQQTGMLGVKSDIYSLGIMLLQIITAKPAMGLTRYVENSIEKGTFEEMLDPAVTDWPVEEALSFAKLALQCAELRRKDRPDLAQVVLPELNRLRELSEENMQPNIYTDSAGPSPNQIYASTPSQPQDVISGPLIERSGCSSKSQSSTSSPRALPPELR